MDHGTVMGGWKAAYQAKLSVTYVLTHHLVNDDIRQRAGRRAPLAPRGFGGLLDSFFGPSLLSGFGGIAQMAEEGRAGLRSSGVYQRADDPRCVGG
mgnify:CR=1 FL=1